MAQLRLVYLATTLFLVILSFFVFKQIEEMIRASRSVTTSTEVTLELEKIIGTLKNAVIAQQGYLMTHDSLFLSSFNLALSKYPEHINILRQLFADDVAQQIKLGELEQIIKDRENYMHELIAIDKNRKPTITEILAGRKIMDSLRMHINTMISLEDLKLTDSHKDLETQTMLTPIFLLALTLVALVILLVSYNKINNELIVAKQLEKNLKTLVMEAPVRIAVLKGPNHILELGNDLYLKTARQKNLLGKPIRELYPELSTAGYFEQLDEVFKTGKTVKGLEAHLQNDIGNGLEDFYINYEYRPLYNAGGFVEGVIVQGMDVTEQVTARKKIEESESQLRIALEAGELGTYDFFPQTGKLFWSAKTKELFGLPAHAEVEYPIFAKALHPDDIERSETVTKNALKKENGGFYENEYRTIGILDGVTRWVRSKGKVTFDKDGNAVRFSGVTQDITNRKLAENKIKESEERFRSLANSAPVLIWMSTPDKLRNFFNKTWLVFSGRTMEKEIDNGWTERIHPNDFDRFMNTYEASFNLRKDFHIEYRLKRYDDEYRWVSDKGSPRFTSDGIFQGYIGACHDIHDQKKALSIIVESEARFRQLSEALPQLIWVTNAQGAWEYTSRRWEEATGIKPQDQNAWDAIVHPDDLQGINAAWQNCLKSGTRYYYDVRLRMKNGEYRWFTVNGEPILDQENNVLKWVGAFTDTHAQKSFAAELEKQVEDRTNELSRKNEELERMNKELESFTYVSSHDLQEPLRKIQTFSSRILEKENENLTETGKNYFKRMQSAAGRMQRLIEDLLAFSRTSTEDRNYETTSLVSIVNEVKDDLRESIIERDVTIQLGELCTISVVRFQFRQLLYNLISNSIKFSKEDTPPFITIESKKVKGESLPSTARTPADLYCQITIKDNGIGFDPHYSDRIFEVFQRLHGRNEYIGTGIGLAIAKKIVENHNGLITATGAVNQGARFDIYIPSV